MNTYNTEIGNDINKAAELLINGELVAIPTETVYGLAGNALNETVVKKIFKAKERPFNNPLIVHISGIDKLPALVKNVPDIALQLLQTFSPGPLTLILPKKDVIPDFVTANSSHVAVRIPNHSLCLDLLKRLPFPLAAPSANKFTGISPTNPSHVFSQLSGEIPYILDGGPCNNGIESTIVGFEDDSVLVYRLGAITMEQIMQIHPHVKLTNDHKIIHSPGMMKHHYAPKTQLVLSENIESTIGLYNDKKIAVLYFKNPALKLPSAYEQVLSATGNLTEAAANLYKVLYELDSQKPDIIIAEKLPNFGLGQSINDRLTRAAAK